MKIPVLLIILILSLFSCSTDEDVSPDRNNILLLPDRNDYLDVDYGTQDLAQEVAQAYSSAIYQDTCRIGLVFYDAATRTVPLITLTGGKWPLIITPLESGALEVGFEKFHTVFMPLHMTTKIKVMLALNATTDTIKIWGTQGMVRTFGEVQTLGAPLPESDDAELVGYYAREDKRLSIVLDLMLSLPMKAHINGTKNK